MPGTWLFLDQLGPVAGQKSYFGSELGFGQKPVVQLVSGGAATSLKDGIGALLNFLQGNRRITRYVQTSWTLLFRERCLFVVSLSHNCSESLYPFVVIGAGD